MTRGGKEKERGQAAVEFGIILSLLFIVTVGASSVGVNFYRYTAVSAAARYAARWASVVGGTCLQANSYVSANADWCNQLTSGNPNFWNTAGNQPLQTTTTGTCLNSSGSPNLSYFYTASSYTSSTSTTIVGTVAHKFDTNSSTTSTILGDLTPGFNLANMKVCIQVQGGILSGSTWTVLPGDTVSVYVLYPFTGTLGTGVLYSANLVSSAQYVIE